MRSGNLGKPAWGGRLGRGRKYCNAAGLESSPSANATNSNGVGDILKETVRKNSIEKAGIIKPGVLVQQAVGQTGKSSRSCTRCGPVGKDKPLNLIPGTKTERSTDRSCDLELPLLGENFIQRPSMLRSPSTRFEKPKGANLRVR